jgi:hypothetical protein
MCDQCQSRAEKLLMTALDHGTGEMETPQLEASRKHLFMILAIGTRRDAEWHAATSDAETDALLASSREEITTYVKSIPTGEVAELAKMLVQFGNIFGGLAGYMTTALRERAKSDDPEAMAIVEEQRELLRSMGEAVSPIAGMVIVMGGGRSKGGTEAPVH